ncbi:hypothetical protein J6590_039726 [Homalodisca vitripennis]|nr:hypothetical protein J6590_039726 [Homalodisca vitripennis]
MERGGRRRGCNRAAPLTSPSALIDAPCAARTAAVLRQDATHPPLISISSAPHPSVAALPHPHPPPVGSNKLSV